MLIVFSLGKNETLTQKKGHNTHNWQLASYFVSPLHLFLRQWDVHLEPSTPALHDRHHLHCHEKFNVKREDVRNRRAN